MSGWNDHPDIFLCLLTSGVCLIRSFYGVTSVKMRIFVHNIQEHTLTFKKSMKERRMNKSLVFGLTGMFLFLVSCSSLQTLSFDQLQAGEVSFPESVKRVGVVNNLPVVTASSRPGVVSAELEGNGKVAAEALAEQLAHVNYFDEVVICDSALRASDIVPRAQVALTKEEVRQLADGLGVDLLFSFDRIHLSTRPSAMWVPELPVPIEAVEASVVSTVRVYVPGREQPLFVVAKPDTLSWEMQLGLCDSVLVNETSEWAAAGPVKHLLPHWETVDRLYYEGGGVEMRDAAVCLRENNWEGAAALWKQVYERSKGKKRMQAAFNLALYAEIREDMVQAEEWLNRAKALVKPGSTDDGLVRIYDKVLQDRRSQVTQLHIQMKRFDANF